MKRKAVELRPPSSSIARTTIDKTGALTSVTMAVPIVYGKGSLPYPSSLRQKINETYIICQAVISFSEFGKRFLIYCDASTYRAQDSSCQENIIQCFQSSEGVTQFSNKIINTISFSPDTLEFQLKERVSNYEIRDATGYKGTLVSIFCSGPL